MVQILTSMSNKLGWLRIKIPLTKYIKIGTSPINIFQYLPWNLSVLFTMTVRFYAVDNLSSCVIIVLSDAIYRQVSNISRSKTRRESFKFWHLVRLIFETLRYIYQHCFIILTYCMFGICHDPHVLAIALLVINYSEIVFIFFIKKFHLLVSSTYYLPFLFEPLTHHLSPILLTWFIFNPSMDKKLHPL